MEVAIHFFSSLNFTDYSPDQVKILKKGEKIMRKV